MTSERSVRRLAGALFRAVVGAAIVALLVWRAGPGRLRAVFAAAAPAPVVLALILIVAGVLVSAERWAVFLRVLGMRRPYAFLARLYAIGLFFNVFLPTGIGGDVFKALRVRRRTEALGPPFASVVLDRVAGVTGLALLVLGGGTDRIVSGDRSPVVAVALVLAAGTLAGGALLALRPPLVRRAAKAATRSQRARGVRQALAGLERAARDPLAGAIGVGWGVVYQASVVAFHVALLHAIGRHVPLGAVVCVVAVATFATLAPITINGLGVREAAYVWALGRYGIDAHAALALALLVLGLLLAAGALGGLVYLAGGERTGGRDEVRVR